MTSHKRTMRMAGKWAVWLAGATVIATVVSVAETHRDFHYTLAPNSSVFVINQSGTITVHPAAGRSLQVAALQKSDKVEIDGSQNGNRVTLRTHLLQNISGDDARVDYDIALPSAASINIDSESGPIKIDSLQGNVTVDSDAGNVTIANMSNGNIQVQTVNAAISLNAIKNSRVLIATTGGNVQLNEVTGPKVNVQTTNGSITYIGDFEGGGVYSLTNHSGDIDVKVPANASIELTARSLKGTVSNDFPFQKPPHVAFQPMQGRAFAGTSNSGASSVELRSFSGKIRVTKQ